MATASADFIIVLIDAVMAGAVVAALTVLGVAVWRMIRKPRRPRRP
jgi:hypothetical protein